MHEDSEGFLYPLVEISLCVDCGVCNSVCPMLQSTEKSTPIQVCAAINQEATTRYASASGGVFSLLAASVIGERGVVFGAAYNNIWEVVHAFSDNMAGVAKFRGSKYMQSRIGNSYQEAAQFLKAGRRVLFTGTPCQIQGLNNYLGCSYDNLVTLDFICHGVPSPKVWRYYLEELLANRSSQPSMVEEISFRDKRHSWRHYDLAIRYQAKGCSCEYIERGSKNLYMRAFLSDISLRPSCYACPAKGGSSGSDITLADYWGVWNHSPNEDYKGGVNLLLLNTPMGKTLYSKVASSAPINSWAVDMKIVDSNQPSYSNSAIAHPMRAEFFEQLERGNTIALLARYFKKGWCARIVALLKKIYNNTFS